MKRIWIAAGLLLIAVGACTTGYIMMNKSVQKLIDILHDGTKAAEKEDYFGAADIAADAKQQWDKTKSFLDVYLNHHEIADLCDYFDLMEDTAESGDIEGFEDLCKSSLNHLNQLLENEKPTLGSVF